MQVLKQQFKTKIKLNRAKPTQSPIICTKVIKTLPNEIASAAGTYLHERIHDFRKKIPGNF